MGVENTAEKSSKSLAAPPCCAGDRRRSVALAGSGRAGRDIPVGQSDFSVWDTPVDRLSPSPPWQTGGARRLQAGRCWGPGSESAAAAADGGDTELLRDPAKGRQAGVALCRSATRRLHLIPGPYCPGRWPAHSNCSQRDAERREEDAALSGSGMKTPAGEGCWRFPALGHTGSWWQSQKVELVLEC